MPIYSSRFVSRLRSLMVTIRQRSFDTQPLTGSSLVMTPGRAVINQWHNLYNHIRPPHRSTCIHRCRKLYIKRYLKWGWTIACTLSDNTVILMKTHGVTTYGQQLRLRPWSQYSSRKLAAPNSWPMFLDCDGAVRTL